MEKQKQLYEKAKAHNKEGDFRNGDFAVYAIQLFDILYPGQLHRADYDVRFSAFKNVLSDWFKNSRDYNRDTLKSEVNRHVDSGPWKKHYIIFGVPLKMKSHVPFIFQRSLKINEVTFRRKTWDNVKKIDDGAFKKELAEIYRKERYSDLDTDRIIRSMYFFEAEVRAGRESIAINQVFDAFALFSAAVTVTQERFTTVYYYLSAGVKSRKPVLNPYLLYVKGNPTTGAYVANDVPLAMPDADLNFTDDKVKVRVYQRYLRIMLADELTPVEQRIKSLVVEFDKAFQLTDPHLRALSLWRCLELSTRHSTQGTRKQDDFIAIVANFRPDDPWKERGKLVSAFRNKYVHEGEPLGHDVRDHYLTWLQEYVSAVLSLLMWMKSHSIGKTSSELDDFFDMYSAPDTKLELAARMLRAKKRLSS